MQKAPVAARLPLAGKSGDGNTPHRPPALHSACAQTRAGGSTNAVHQAGTACMRLASGSRQEGPRTAEGETRQATMAGPAWRRWPEARRERIRTHELTVKTVACKPPARRLRGSVRRTAPPTGSWVGAPSACTGPVGVPNRGKLRALALCNAPTLVAIGTLPAKAFGQNALKNHVIYRHERTSAGVQAKQLSLNARPRAAFGPSSVRESGKPWLVTSAAPSSSPASRASGAAPLRHLGRTSRASAAPQPRHRDGISI